jgi:hypothetical protein
MLALAGDQKRRMMLIGLSAVLLIALVIRFVGSGASNGGSSGGGSLAFLGARAGVFDSDPSHLQTVAKIATSRARTIYAGQDVRDPMVPLVADRRSSSSSTGQSREAPAPITLPPMTLSGIVWDPESALAMIDGMALHVGDTIKEARIVEIGIDRVALVYRSKRFVLTVD